MQNPFTPTFGIVPACFAGRNQILSDMRRAFQNGPGDPSLCSIIIGPRGSGKTALLSCIADEARQSGYIVAETTAASGMLEDILQRALSESAEIVRRKGKKRLTGLTIGQFLGIEWQEETTEKANWRTRMTELLRELQKTDTGLLITVDEVRADIEEMIRLAAIYQLLIRERAKCALVMAGLAIHCNQILSNDSSSFLRRAKQYALDRISDTEVERAFRKTVEQGGKKIAPDALAMAVQSSAGYAYMIQLVGFSIWEEASSARTIVKKDAAAGIAAAEKDFRNGVLHTTYRDLSKGDIAFLRAVSERPEENRISDIAERMQKSTGYVSSYKTRMLEAGIIEETSGRSIVFSMPAFRAYLEEMNP